MKRLLFCTLAALTALLLPACETQEVTTTTTTEETTVTHPAATTTTRTVAY